MSLPLRFAAVRFATLARLTSGAQPVGVDFVACLAWVVATLFAEQLNNSVVTILEYVCALSLFAHFRGGGGMCGANRVEGMGRSDSFYQTCS